MVSFQYVVKDEQGIHARPAGLLVKAIAGLSSKVTIKKGEKAANGKMILAVMSLSVKCGEEITVEVEGDNAEADAATVKTFLEENL
ncbi:MAG: HPr family phosphocarrier protein [Lachnospiraceae bacterium]|nr:HPr family phosphocarrier protein [Lachnospiraceae bacterium]